MSAQDGEGKRGLGLLLFGREGRSERDDKVRRVRKRRIEGLSLETTR
jgi:hypothetical protein